MTGQWEVGNDGQASVHWARVGGLDSGRGIRRWEGAVSLALALERTVRLYGDRPAIIDPERNLSWAEFGERVARAAAVLSSFGLRTGARFAILAQNSFRQAELMHAGYWMGVVPVPVNTRLALPEIRQVLDDAACELVAVDETFSGKLDSEELFPWRERALFMERDYESRLAGETPLAAHDSGQNDDAILLYTGGTTGQSKGVRLTHGNLLAHGMQWALTWDARPDDVYLHAAPMFHSADLLGTAYTLLGAAHAYVPRYTPELVLDAVERSAVTTLVLTPTMLILTLQDGDLAAHDLSSLRQLTYGGSPMPVEWIEHAAKEFSSTEIRQGYGLTESSCVLTALGKDEHAQALAGGDTTLLHSVGRPLIGVCIRILDDDGREVKVGETGEVAVCGPNMTPGYLNQPEENASAFRNGWFHTGDIGRVDENGYLYLVDRKKDMIVTGGENVFAWEVETVLYQHPNVHEAAVIGIPDERYGEALLAAIVPMPGATLSEKEVIAHCRRKIGGYKIPRRILFLDALPKSAIGKILKTELRRTYAKIAGTPE